MLSELAIKDLDLGLGVNILFKLWGVRHRVVIDPEYFKVEVLEFLNDLVGFFLGEKVGHEGEGDSVGWELEV